MKALYQCSACVLSFILIVSHFTEAADKLATGRFKSGHGPVKRFSDFVDFLAPPMHNKEPEPNLTHPHQKDENAELESFGHGGSMMEEFLVYLTLKDSGLLDLCLGEFRKKK